VARSRSRDSRGTRSEFRANLRGATYIGDFRWRVISSDVSVLRVQTFVVTVNVSRPSRWCLRCYRNKYYTPWNSRCSALMKRSANTHDLTCGSTTDFTFTSPLMAIRLIALGLEQSSHDIWYSATIHWSAPRISSFRNDCLRWYILYKEAGKLHEILTKVSYYFYRSG